MNCRNCKFFRDGVCRIPLYVEGVRYEGRQVKPEDGCELFEEARDVRG